MLFDLKSPSDTDCHISCSTKLQIFGRKWNSFHTAVDFSHFKTNWIMQVIRGGPWCKNIVKNCRRKIFGYFVNFVAAAYKFFWWIKTKLSFSNSSSNEEVLSPYVILKVLSCNGFIVLPFFCCGTSAWRDIN